MHPVRHLFHFIAVLLIAYLVPGAVVTSDAKDGYSRQLMGGEALLQFCGGHYDTDLGVCNGYIMAVSEAMTTSMPVFGQRACGHAAVKAPQLVALVRMGARDSPQIRTLPAGVMVANILADAFPCDEGYTPAAGGHIGGHAGHGGRAVTAEPLPPLPY